MISKSGLMSFSILLLLGTSLTGMNSQLGGMQADEELIDGALSGSIALMESAFKRGAQIHAKTSEGFRALDAAVCNGHLGCLRILLDKGAQIEATSRDGNTALHWTATLGRLNCLEELLSRGAQVEAKRDDGRTALHLAVQEGHSECMKKLLEKGARLECKDNQGQTPLHTASRSGRLEFVKELLSRGARIEERDNESQTPLHSASRHGHYDCVKELLSKGAQIEAKDSENKTALHMAAFCGDSASVRELLSKGAQVEAKDHYGKTPLHAAVYFDDRECIRELLSRGAQIGARDNEDRTVLDVAADLGFTESVIELLTCAGQIVNLNDALNRALYRAVWAGEVECVRTVLLAKARLLIDGDSRKIIAPAKSEVEASRRRLKALLMSLLYAGSGTSQPKKKLYAGLDIVSNAHLRTELLLSYSGTRKDVYLVLMDLLAKGKKVAYPLFAEASNHIGDYLVVCLENSLRELNNSENPLSLSVRNKRFEETAGEILMLCDPDLVEENFGDVIRGSFKACYLELLKAGSLQENRPAAESSSQSTSSTKK